MESGNLLIEETISIIENVEERLHNVNCASGEIIYLKFKDVLKKNQDFETIKSINKVLTGQREEELPLGVQTNNLQFYKKCLLASVDVERTFSRYKNLLRDNRKGFLYENLRKHVVINCNRETLGFNKGLGLD